MDDSEGKDSAKGKEKLSLLTCFKGIKDKLEERHPMVLLMHRHYYLLTNNLNSSLLSYISSLLQGYENVFPPKIPKGFPPIRGTEYQNNFISGS